LPEDVTTTTTATTTSTEEAFSDVMNQAQHNAYPNNKATDGAWPPAFAENKFYDATSSVCWDTSSKK